MLNEKLRPIIEPFTAGTGKVLARAHISPNALTTVGLAAMLGCAWLVAAGETFRAGLLLIPAFFLDVFDGALARATGRVTPWGGFYDSVCDRLADGALFGGFVWLAYDQRLGGRFLAAALAALVTTMLVPYARAKAEALGYRAPGGLGERAERAVVVCAGLILGFEEAALWVLAALCFTTFVRRSVAVRAQASG